MMTRAMWCPPLPGCCERGLIRSAFLEGIPGDEKGLTGLGKGWRGGGPGEQREPH